ncbi:MAG: hypothetical protein AAF518_15245 [Spirochaetota bacterium]
MKRLLPVDRTDFLIPLPCDLLLTPSGARVFTKGRVPLKSLDKIEGGKNLGLSSKNYNAQTVQKLVINGYLDEIFTQMPDLLRMRSQIIDTTKLLLFGILYKKMNPSIAGMLLNSPVMKDYNRKNVRKPINSLQDLDLARIEQINKSRENEMEVLELEVRDKVVQRIIIEKDLQEEDRLLRIRSLDKFIAFIDKRIWYLYYIVYQTNLKYRALDTFSNLVYDYLDRTKIATHLSNMIMELIQNAEKVHFEGLLRNNKLANTDREIDRFLRDPENRKKAIVLAQQQKQLLQIAWRLSSEEAVGRPYKIEIVINNHGVISNRIQRELSQKMQTHSSDVTMADFYNDPGDEGKLGAGLGLLYMSYLQEECKTANLKFRCQIYPVPEKDITTVKTEIIF